MSQQIQQSTDRTAARTEARTFPTANDLPPGTRGTVIRSLNQMLADTTDLTTQLKFAHWNVKGINFYQLHLLFDEIAEVLEGHADMLAERATSLGGQAMGTARMAAANSSIPELSADTVTGPQYVEEVTEHLAVHAANLRDGIDYAASCGDEDTADLYTELSREVDQQLYFLESHLQTQFEGTASQLESGQMGQQPPWAAPTQRSGAPQPQRVTFSGAQQPGQYQ